MEIEIHRSFSSRDLVNDLTQNQLMWLKGVCVSGVWVSCPHCNKTVCVCVSLVLLLSVHVAQTQLLFAEQDQRVSTAVPHKRLDLETT